MAKTTVQDLTVEMVGDTVTFLPVTNVTSVQQLSAVRANDAQTVVLQPVA